MQNTARLQNIYKLYIQNKELEEFLHVRKAVELIEACLTQSKFQHFYVSFNGGKDATIVLFLTYFALKNLKMNTQIRCVYFKEPRSFSEADSFMEEVKKMIQIDMTEFQTKNYPGELTSLKNSKGLDWVVMGTRKDDPGCSKLGQIAESNVEKGYPAFKRINPIIDWTYSMVWNFINAFQIPYCSLYDEGYTYLGNMDNTKKNTTLYDPNTNKYKKAWQAKDQVETQSRAVPQT